MTDKEIRGLKAQDLLHVQLASSRHRKVLQFLCEATHGFAGVAGLTAIPSATVVPTE